METPSRKNGLVGYIVSLSVIALIAYFSYSAIQGPSGLVSLFKYQAQEARLQEDLNALQLERQAAKNRTRRMSDRFLDLDLLDEQTRKVLGYARGDEVILR